MKKDTQISKKFGIPTRTLADWKKKVGYRRKIYDYLKADAGDIMAMLYLGEWQEPQVYEPDGVSLADTVVELGIVFSYLDKIDTNQCLLGVQKAINKAIDGDYSLEETKKIVAFYNLKKSFEKVFN